MGNTFGANYWDGLAGIAMVSKGGFGVFSGMQLESVFRFAAMFCKRIDQPDGSTIERLGYVKRPQMGGTSTGTGPRYFGARYFYQLSMKLNLNAPVAQYSKWQPYFD